MTKKGYTLAWARARTRRAALRRATSRRPATGIRLGRCRCLSAYIASSAQVSRAWTVAAGLRPARGADAEGDGIRQVAFAGFEPAAHAVEQVAAILSRQIGQQHAEFVTAGPTGDVVLAQVRDQELAHVLQHAVPDRVPVAVVGGLEVVQVEHHHRESPAEPGSLRTAQLLVQALLEKAPVPQGGEGIAVCHRTVDLQARELALERGVLAASNSRKLRWSCSRVVRPRRE